VGQDKQIEFSFLRIFADCKVFFSLIALLTIWKLFQAFALKIFS
jgi:hypothetical protein